MSVLKEYYSVSEVAELLGISNEASRRLILGKLDHLRIGKLIRVRIEVFEAFRAKEVSPTLPPPQSSKTLLPTSGRFLLH